MSSSAKPLGASPRRDDRTEERSAWDLRSWLLPRDPPISPAGLGVLGAALLLLAIGLVTVYSASFYRALVREVGQYFFLEQQILGAGLGLVALAIASRIDPRRWIDLAPLVIEEHCPGDPSRLRVDPDR